MNQLLDFINQDKSAKGAITQQDFDSYFEGHHADIESAVLSLSGRSEDEFFRYLSERLGLQCLSYENAAKLIDEIEIQNAYKQPINWKFLARFNWFPLKFKDHVVTLATNKPFNKEVKSLLNFQGTQFEIVLSPESLLQRVVGIFEQTQELEMNNIVEVEKLRAMALEAPVVNLVNSLIARALDAGASDMHIEPVESGGRVRVRVDGILQKLDDIPHSLVMPVISRIKILAAMDIAEKRRPQDGKIALHGRNIDIRASVLPLNNGESVVMRFLVKGSLRFDMTELGFEADTIELIKRDLQRTAGVILMTGPTGSGKTTTLYSFLQQLNSSHEKIITLEDPVEYELEGINQIQVNADIGFDFAAGLRSIVRQDPDVIMVGEIRDAETARIAMQSSLTGHLVFSTVHTNDAPSAYVRLIDLGVDEFLLNASVISIIAQRLVRKLCAKCAIPDPNAAQIIEKANLSEISEQAGITPIVIKKAVGCECCNNSGYSGRLALIEYLPNNNAIKALDKDSGFTLKAENYMADNNMRTLYKDGLLKVIRGQTTIEEVIRVAG